MADRIVSTAEKKFITLSSEIIYFIPNIWLGLSFSIGGNSVFSPTAPAHVAFNKVWRCFPGLSQLRRVLLPSNEWETGILNIYGTQRMVQPALVVHDSVILLSLSLSLSTCVFF